MPTRPRRPMSYFVALGAGPAAVNFVANLAIGLVLFPFGDAVTVPWRGGASLATDGFIGILLVGFITAWGAHPKVVRGASAGHVAGLAETSAWRVLPGGRGALVASVALLVTAAAWLGLTPLGEALWPDGLGSGSAALWKGITTALGGQVALGLVGMRALVAQPDRTAELTQALERAAQTPGQAFEPLDKGCLACTDRTRGISVAPTWHLVVDGALDDGLLVRSLAALARRYPSITARALPVDGLAETARDFRWVFGADDTGLFEPSDEPVAVARRRVFDRHLDLFGGPPMVVTRVREAGQVHLFVQQHHALADGRAFIGLLVDWAATLRALAEGREPLGGVVQRRAEDDALGLAPAARKRLLRRGFWRFVRERWALARAPLVALPPNQGRDYSGANDVVRAVVPMAALEGLRAAREAAGVSLNSLLTAVYLRATARAWTAGGAHPTRLTCEVIAETRPRDGSFVSFANHLSAYRVAVEGAALTELVACAQTVQRQVAAEAAAQAHVERALFRGWGVRVVPIDALRRLVLDVAELRAQVGFSNLVALPIPELAGPGWRVREVWVTTPAAPPHGVTLTATHYAGTVAFNFNFKASVVDEPAVRALAEAFVSELQAFAPGLEARVGSAW